MVYTAARPALATTSTRPAERVTADPAGGFRNDIEGLRAIAVTVVVLYHFGLLRLTGGFVGVDVFFVISGFLITRQLLRSVETHGAAALPRFYASRFRRLLPAAAVVIVAVFLAVKIWVPTLEQPQMFRDGAASALYSMNYTLAIRGTEYLHANDAPSPFQHFWSLGVEEQFYLLWPALILGVFLVARRRARALLAIVAVVSGVASLYACLTLTTSSNPWAYFSLWTRWWELALGGLIAFGATALTRVRGRFATVLATVLPTVGVAAIAYTCLTYTDRTLYPGWATVVPVVGTGLAIAGGTIRADGIVLRGLGCPPMKALGRISYSLYLWHWPIIVIAPYALGHLTTLDKCGLLALSVVCASQSFWIVEASTRGLRLLWARWVAVGVVGAVLVAGAGVSLADAVPTISGTGAAASVSRIKVSGSGPVARADSIISDGVLTKLTPKNLTPTLTAAANDVPNANYNGCHADYTAVAQGPCVYGDPTGKQTAVLFGDSHMEQWLPGFDAAGKQAGWKVVSWTKAGCPFGQVTPFNPSLNQAYTNCGTWRTATLARIAALKPSTVFLSEYEDIADGQFSNAKWVSTSVQTVAWLRAHTTAKIVFLADSPKPTSVVPQCIAANLSHVDRCTFSTSRAAINPARHQALNTAMKAAGATVVDPVVWLCQSGECPVIVGQYLVYRDDNHLTATFAAWLAPVLKTLLPAAK